jgi:hypothetical protein
MGDEVHRFRVLSISGLWYCLFKSYVRDRVCGLVVRVPGYRSRGPGSIPNAVRFPEK